MIQQVTIENAPQWAALCNAFWPHNPAEEMMEAFRRGEYTQEYLYYADGVPVAFLSLSLRKDYVEGKCDSLPVGYVEGIYVQPPYRGRGIAGEMIAFAKGWAQAQGCTMLASDCELGNEESRRFHNKIGFVEESINIHFSLDLKKR